MFAKHIEDPLWTVTEKENPYTSQCFAAVEFEHDLIFSSKAQKRGKHSKNCCHTFFSEHPYIECSHYRFLQYLHTGNLSRYFLWWLVLILGEQSW